MLILEEQLAKLPLDDFSKLVVQGALRVVADAENPIRLNLFAAAIGELYGHTLDRLAPDAEVEPQAQLGVDARRTVGLAAACVDLADLLAEERVLNGSGRWRPGCPGVVAGACHTQHAA